MYNINGKTDNLPIPKYLNGAVLLPFIFVWENIWVIIGKLQETVL